MSLTTISWTPTRDALQALLTTPLTSGQQATVLAEQTAYAEVAPAPTFTPDPWGATEVLAMLNQYGADYDALVGTVNAQLAYALAHPPSSYNATTAQADVSATSAATNVNASLLSIPDLLTRLIAQATILIGATFPWSITHNKPFGYVGQWPWLAA